MKHGGPYMTGDCIRSIKAIASADGRILYIAPYEGQKRGPAVRESRRDQRQNKMYTIMIAQKKEESQCRR